MAITPSASTGFVQPSGTPGTKTILFKLPIPRSVAGDFSTFISAISLMKRDIGNLLLRQSQILQELSLIFLEKRRFNPSNPCISHANRLHQGLFAFYMSVEIMIMLKRCQSIR